MKTKVYIDGQAGTTGLQIYERIGERDDLELLRIDEEKRHDLDERKRFLNMADIVFLCLPDAGAIEAVSLIENPDVRVIDASTAHRTSDDWTSEHPMTGPTAIRNCQGNRERRLLIVIEWPIRAAMPQASSHLLLRSSAWVFFLQIIRSHAIPSPAIRAAARR